MYIVNIEGAVHRGGQYLLVVRGSEEEHAAGMLSLIGGKVEGDPGADVIEATLRREIREEVDVEIADRVEYVESKSFSVGANITVVDLVFLCEYVSGEPRIVDLGEVAAIRWMTAQEVMDDPSAPSWTKQSIERAEAIRTKHL